MLGKIGKKMLFWTDNKVDLDIKTIIFSDFHTFDFSTCRAPDYDHVINRL